MSFSQVGLGPTGLAHDRLDPCFSHVNLHGPDWAHLKWAFHVMGLNRLGRGTTILAHDRLGLYFGLVNLHRLDHALLKWAFHGLGLNRSVGTKIGPWALLMMIQTDILGTLTFTG